MATTRRSVKSMYADIDATISTLELELLQCMVTQLLDHLKKSWH